MALAFVSPWISVAIYIFVALLWVVPDRRIERVLGEKEALEPELDEGYRAEGQGASLDPAWTTTDTEDL